MSLNNCNSVKIYNKLIAMLLMMTTISQNKWVARAGPLMERMRLTPGRRAVVLGAHFTLLLHDEKIKGHGEGWLPVS